MLTYCQCEKEGGVWRVKNAYVVEAGRGVEIRSGFRFVCEKSGDSNETKMTNCCGANRRRGQADLPAVRRNAIHCARDFVNLPEATHEPFRFSRRSPTFIGVSGNGRSHNAASRLRNRRRAWILSFVGRFFGGGIGRRLAAGVRLSRRRTFSAASGAAQAANANSAATMGRGENSDSMG